MLGVVDFRAKNNLFDNLMIGNETWVHLNTQCEDICCLHCVLPLGDQEASKIIRQFKMW